MSTGVTRLEGVGTSSQASEASLSRYHAIDGLVAQHDKVVKRIESDQLRDVFDAGAAAKTEHLEIAAYENMITAAEALQERGIVDLLKQNLEEEKEALEKVEQVSEQIAG